MGFVMDKAALRQVFSEYFGFPCHTFHRLLHAYHYPSSGTGTAGQIVTKVENGLNLARTPEKKVMWFVVLSVPVKHVPGITSNGLPSPPTGSFPCYRLSD
jgi:hypothetical protein